MSTYERILRYHPWIIHQSIWYLVNHMCCHMIASVDNQTTRRNIRFVITCTDFVWPESFSVFTFPFRIIMFAPTVAEFGHLLWATACPLQIPTNLDWNPSGHAVSSSAVLCVITTSNPPSGFVSARLFWGTTKSQTSLEPINSSLCQVLGCQLCNYSKLKTKEYDSSQIQFLDQCITSKHFQHAINT